MWFLHKTQKKSPALGFPSRRSRQATSLEAQDTHHSQKGVFTQGGACTRKLVHRSQQRDGPAWRWCRLLPGYVGGDKLYQQTSPNMCICSHLVGVGGRLGQSHVKKAVQLDWVPLSPPHVHPSARSRGVCLKMLNWDHTMTTSCFCSVTREQKRVSFSLFLNLWKCMLHF